jgi:nucleoside-diphosphate-sugar epimerase
MSQSILITGGAGYVGSVLVPELLRLGYRVTVYDTFFFGHGFLPQNHPGLRVIEADIRDTEVFAKSCQQVDAVLHLACISNDPSFELDENLSKTINFDCFEPLVLAAKDAGVRRFVYCSSSSVYGVSEAPDVTEDHPLVPLTLYNKFKGLCEPLLLRHLSDSFEGVIVRPATLCGYSPRMRFDLSVNILTNHAVNADKITVFGGTQLRPNLHIQDMVDAYVTLLTAPAQKIQGQIFNISTENLSILKIAELVRDVVKEEYPEKGEVPIVTTPSNDLRSYHVNSDKIRRVLGFVPKRTVSDAVRDLCRAFRAGKLANTLDDERYFNVRTMKAIHAR